MDKSIGTLYHKLTNFFHTNTSTPSSSTTSSTSDTSTSLPISTFFDRLIPSTNAHSPVPNRRSNTSRISRQISIKTNNNPLPSQTYPTYVQKTSSIKISKQQNPQ